MKKKISKLISLGSLVIILGSATTLAANRGTFSFDFSTAVQGSTKFSLDKKNTTCKSYGVTYRPNGDPISKNFTYELELEQTKLFGKTYNANKTITADGIYHTVGFGSIEKNTYNVNIGSPDSQEMHSYGASICGKGELFQ